MVKSCFYDQSLQSIVQHKDWCWDHGLGVNGGEISELGSSEQYESVGQCNHNLIPASKR